MLSGGVSRAAVPILTRALQAVFLPEGMRRRPERPADRAATDFIAPAASVAQLTNSPENARFLQGICDAARQHQVWVSVGVHEPAEPGADGSREPRCYNTQVLVDQAGDVRERYRKLHLFDVDVKSGPALCESNTTIPGTRLVPPVQTPVGKLGMLTCYDMRFPEPSLALRRRGAELLTYPSAFAVRTGAAHWSLLLRARAAETQCWVLAAAQVGLHAGTTRSSWGHAMVVDPWGSVVAQCSDMPPFAPTFCLADVDLGTLAQVRADMPLWHQRRQDIYGEL